MSSFWQVLLLSESYPFLVSIQVVVVLFAIEVFDYILFGCVLGTALDNLIDFDFGTEIDMDADVDMDAEADIDSEIDADVDAGWINKFLSWMYIGEVPVMILAVILLSSFGLIGWFMQYAASMMLGAPLPELIAVAASLVLSVVVTHYAAMPIAYYLPSHESYAIEKDDLTGKTAEITQGTARSDLSARAVISLSGQRINVRVIPSAAEKESYPTGTRVELKRKVSEDSDLYEVVAVE